MNPFSKKLISPTLRELETIEIKIPTSPYAFASIRIYAYFLPKKIQKSSDFLEKQLIWGLICIYRKKYSSKILYFCIFRICEENFFL